MASQKVTWDRAITDALQANRGTGRPETDRQLAAEVARLGSLEADSGRKTVARGRQGTLEEPQIALIAAALEVHRSTLPAAWKPNLRALHDRLEQLEDGLAELLDGQREILARLDEGGSQGQASPKT